MYLPYNTHCRLVHLICEDPSIIVKLHKRFLKFFINLGDSKNHIVRMMAQNVKHGSRSKACASLNYICSVYDLNKHNLSKSCLKKLIDDNDRSDIITAGAVSDFMEMRRLHPSDTGITDIIEFLCTS